MPSRMGQLARKKMIGAAIGDCVHVAGVVNFLRLAEEAGYRTYFLGPAVSIEELLGAAIEIDADVIGVSYRLTPEVGGKLLRELKSSAGAAGLLDKSFIFGGTPPVAKIARELDFFDAVFTGEEPIEEVLNFLKGEEKNRVEEGYPDNLIERISWRKPFPIIRHHFGLPSLERTIEGARHLAEARVLDVISIGPDQACQERFFHPEEIDESTAGAGGVPCRKEEDFRAIFEASRCGNYPLVRSYSGTRDLFKMAEMLLRTIRNAWCAVPLCWYNVLDGRGPRGVEESIRENQELMAWHARRGVPVEVNEAHHWSLRDAHDTIAVVMAYLAAYNAKKQGVTHYIAQYMFNTPVATSPAMDLAKMLAKREMIETLVDKRFRVYTQVRAGLASFPVDLMAAKGQLASSTFLGMAMKPDIVHVVAFSEADHAALPEDIIESCKIASQVIKNCIYDLPDMTLDPRIQTRKGELLNEAGVLLNAIRYLGEKNFGAADPLTDPETLAFAIRIGLLDTPHFRETKYSRGGLQTRIIEGACRALNPETKEVISEEERVDLVFKTARKRAML